MRDEKNLTQGQLGKQAGVCFAVVCQIEKGTYGCESTIIRVCDALGLSYLRMMVDFTNQHTLAILTGFSEGYQSLLPEESGPKQPKLPFKK
jgi:DNA-binding XRE family transcriptional regulator